LKSGAANRGAAGVSESKCETCRYWSGDAVSDGMCRRYAPRATVAAGENDDPDERTFDRYPLWPRTLNTEWCGEWQAKPDGTLDGTAKALALTVLAGDLTAARPLADRVCELANG